MAGSVGEVVARRASRQLLGRRRELEKLQRLLDADLPRVAHLHGVPGIGKSSLLQMLAARAAESGARVVSLDGRALEPTGAAVRQALAHALGVQARDATSLASAFEAQGCRVLVTLDGYETLRLADGWIRDTLVPALPQNVRVVLAGRVRPTLGWLGDTGWEGVFESLEVGALETADALQLLHENGVGVVLARRVAHQVQRHPLALRLAIAALRERHELALNDDVLQQALEQLTDMLLEDVRDPTVREAAAAAAVVRRVTRPVLTAMCPQAEPVWLLEQLHELAFVDVAHDGLRVHEAVRPALVRYLHARDPQRHRQVLRDVWRQLVAGSGEGGSGQLWRDTADILYLIENPVVREAFFPLGASGSTTVAATPGHAEAIHAIIRAHEGPCAASHLQRWWQNHPTSFQVVVDAEGASAGFHCSLDPAEVTEAWLWDDPLTAAWQRHLRAEPLPTGQRVLFLRRWLGRDEGEVPSDVQAACWLDIKRLYMEKRPQLRRVYLAVVNFERYAPVAAQLGFRPLPAAHVEMDGRQYHSAVLDFGPGSVDGWLAGLAADELGVAKQAALLDMASRELVLPEGRTELTPLEFGLLRYLTEREGEAVSRDALLRDVWQSVATQSSNVVDAVVASLRRKLGAEAGRVQTVKGVGYRYRAPVR